MARRTAPPKKPPWPRLLVAVDFSPASRAAFEAARGLARDLGAGIVLVHVTPRALRKDLVPDGGPYLTPPEAALEDAVALSSTWAEELREDDLFVKSLNPVGPPAQTIVDLAAKHACAAIVVGTTGRSALKAALIGSVARDVIRLSPLPVLVVPSTVSKTARRLGPPAPPAKAIVVATDFSDEAELAGRAALGLAKDLKCLLRAVHVVPLVGMAAPYPVSAEFVEAAMEHAEDHGAQQLALLASRARKDKVGMVPSLQVGHAATAILAEARATGAALIVMGTHGMSGAHRFFLGSVAQTVVQSSDRPVLVVPGKRKERGAWRR